MKERKGDKNFSNNMKIIINATILNKKNTGLGVYTYNILENIIPKMKCLNYCVTILCKSKNYLPENCRNDCVEVDFKNFIQRNIVVKKYVTSDYDYYWSTTQHGINNCPCKQIITIHDLTPFFYPKGRIHQWFYYFFLLKKIIRKSYAIITCSENTKKDICNIYHISDKKVFNAYESVSINNKNAVEIKNHFVIIGIHYPYKNIHFTIETFHRFHELKKYKVYIIGNSQNKYGLSLKKMVKKYNLGDNFVFTGFINENEKSKLINSSKALIFPSLYEGFGIPILEAMGQGIPVLCSNCSSFPEVGGDAAIYFDPNDYESLKRSIEYVEQNSNREKMIKKGYDNIKRFSWEKTSEIILSLFKK